MVYPGHTPEVRKKESSTERCMWKAPSPAPGLPVRPGGVGGGVEPGQENPRGVSSQCPCTLAHGLREAVSACHTACRLWSMPGGLAQRGTILLKVVMLVTEQSPGPEGTPVWLGNRPWECRGIMPPALPCVHGDAEHQQAQAQRTPLIQKPEVHTHPHCACCQPTGPRAHHQLASRQAAGALARHRLWRPGP